MGFHREQRRVVVTGMGALTPVGNSVEEFWTSILAGVSGAAPIKQFDASGYDTKFACELKGFDASKYLDRKLVQRSDPFTHYALAATEMAVQDAQIDFTKFDRDRVGVVFGSGIGGLQTFTRQSRSIFESGGPHRISPFFIPMIILNMASGVTSILTGAKGPNTCVSTACATGGNAIGDANPPITVSQV